jgi:hypothetical protein
VQRQDNAKRLVELYDEAVHVTAAGNADGILRNGLLSTVRLLDVFEVDAETRGVVCTRPRQQSVELVHDVHGKASVRDQRPLNVKRLGGALTGGMSVGEWLELLDTFVFFWPCRQKAAHLLGRSTYANLEHDVLTVPTSALIARHQDGLRLTRINTGSTRPVAFPRGRDTFMPLEDERLTARLLRGRRDRAVAEIVVSDWTPEIRDLVVRVERWRGPTPLEVLWERA